MIEIVMYVTCLWMSEGRIVVLECDVMECYERRSSAECCNWRLRGHGKVSRLIAEKVLSVWPLLFDRSLVDRQKDDINEG
jgi:hypothetical protein